MKILALIPARGGSKRVPGKNIKVLGGLPLIAWTIRAALESGVCAAVVVSTDDPEIAEVALKYGATVPGLRPAQLATDTAGSIDVALHALDLYESKNGPIDGLLLLQPTSPFRSAETIRRGVQIFGENEGKRQVVSVSRASCHPAWCFRTSSEGIEPFLSWDDLSKRSQDLEPAWMLNGAFYLTSPESLRQKKEFLTQQTLPLVIRDQFESLDIDTPDDWKVAEDIIYRNENS
jgi:N-acylneuraminate cytidylyltransferase/CMP-N,N'-diacetyllegionaminic acid synthase